MGLESQSAINPHHKSCPIKADQPSIAWIKFITLSSSFGPSLECPALESAQISWISPLNASLIFLDLALVIGPTGTWNGSLNALWFSSLWLWKFQCTTNLVSNDSHTKDLLCSSQILHCKLFGQLLLQIINLLNAKPCNKHIIYIQQ